MRRIDLPRKALIIPVFQQSLNRELPSVRELNPPLLGSSTPETAAH